MFIFTERQKAGSKDLYHFKLNRSRGALSVRTVTSSSCLQGSWDPVLKMHKNKKHSLI